MRHARGGRHRGRLHQPQAAARCWRSRTRIVVMRRGRSSPTSARECARLRRSSPTRWSERARRARRSAARPAPESGRQRSARAADESRACAAARSSPSSASPATARRSSPNRCARLPLATTRGAHIPEDRTRDGLVAEMTHRRKHRAVANRAGDPRAATQRAARADRDASRSARSRRGKRAGSLSGGNQQKVILARELDRKPELLVAAEPTRGLDIESTRFVHDELRVAAARGAAIAAHHLRSRRSVRARRRASTSSIAAVSARRLTPDEARRAAPALMAGVA